MKEYHVLNNERIKGTFNLYCNCDDSRGWFLYGTFNDLEGCWSERFVIPNLCYSKITEVFNGSEEEVHFYMD